MGVVVKVTPKHQVTLPKEVREALGIRVGDLLRVRVGRWKDNLGASSASEKESSRGYAKPSLRAR